MRPDRITLLFSLLCLAAFPAAAQETSGSFTGGSVMIGYDNRACIAGLESAIRYTAATDLWEFCNGTAWTNLSSGGVSSIDNLTDAYTDYTTLNNLIMGRAGAAALTAGAQYNLFIGEGAGATTAASTAATDLNTAVGYQALNGLSAGYSNTAIGVNALFATGPGNSNVAVGTSALQFNVGKADSTAVGYQAMLNADSNATPGVITYNTAVGAYALRGSATPANNTGIKNTAIGHSALIGNTSGYDNTALGYSALLQNTTGLSNVAIGSNTLSSNVAKRDNVAIGVNAQRYAWNDTTQDSVYNTAVGANALLGSTTPANNTGYRNTALGANTMTGTTSGYENVAVGFRALELSTTGQNNVAVGTEALDNVLGGSFNTAIGFAAGNVLTTGSSNILIGYDVDAPAATTSNHLNIGNTIYGDLSTGAVGIGTASPSDVEGWYNGALVIYGDNNASVSPSDLILFTANGSSSGHKSDLEIMRAGGNPASPAILAAGDYYGTVRWSGHDGGNMEIAAEIGARLPGGMSPGEGDMPSEIYFRTRPDGSPASVQDRMVIDANGDVGIGTATPGNQLDIYKASGFNTAHIENDGTTILDGPSINIDRGGTSAWGSIDLATAGFSYTGIGLKGGDATNGFSVWDIQNGSAIRFFVEGGTGNVGIGMASPQSTLHVPDGKYAQFEDNNAGAPPAADCDADAERGRMSIDTTNNRLYVCNGATRGWDYTTLTD